MLNMKNKNEKQFNLKLLFFWSEHCPNCHPCRDILDSSEYPYTPLDITTVDGMSEAVFYNVQSTPTVLIIDADTDTVLDSFHGTTPLLSDLDRYFKKPTQ